MVARVFSCKAKSIFFNCKSSSSTIYNVCLFVYLFVCLFVTKVEIHLLKGSKHSPSTPQASPKHSLRTPSTPKHPQALPAFKSLVAQGSNVRVTTPPQ